MKIVLSFAIVLSVLASLAFSHDGVERPWSPDQKHVLAAIARLSAATAPGGGGAEAYGDVLSSEFSRWSVGRSDVINKDDWVAGMKEWFDGGWRVIDRKTHSIEIRVDNDFAFTRRLVEEIILGPENQRSVSTAAVTEVWTRNDSGWLLLIANVHHLESSD